jgi:D-alanine-D-alanine ligase
MAKLAVVFGGPSPEHDISILTGLQVARLLDSGGHEIACVYWSKSGRWTRVPIDIEPSAFLEPAVPRAAELQLRVPGGFIEPRRLRAANLSLDAVVNCCHGGPGEDGGLSALLRLAGLRVTGPSSEAAALAMDKYGTTAVVAELGIPTIPSRLGSDTIDFPPPWVVKPRFGGSSLGIEVGVADEATVAAIARSGVSRAGTIVQPYLNGWVDLNVAVRTHPNPETSEIERPLHAEAYLDYQTKYLRGRNGMESAPRELPAAVPDSVSLAIKSAALKVVHALGLTGLPRIDFMWDGEEAVQFCEVNPIPGAMGLYLWAASGAARESILQSWIDEALTGPILPAQWAASSDGAALKVASSISTKLAL